MSQQLQYLSKVFIGEAYMLSSTLLYAIATVGGRRATTGIAGPTTFVAWSNIISTVLLCILRFPIKSSIVTHICVDKEPEDIQVLVQIKRRLSFINEYSFDLYFWGTILGIFHFTCSVLSQYGLVTVQGNLLPTSLLFYIFLIFR
jgi:hypothetical protein